MTAVRASDLDWVYRRLGAMARRSERRCYRIPALWDCWGYVDARSSGPGEVAVRVHEFMAGCLEQVILPARRGRRLGRRSLSQALGVRRAAGGKVLDGGVRRKGGDWIRSAIVYGMLVRATTAWDHDGDGHLVGGKWTETGTFLKSILLLPLLARMGIDVICLLPVSETSQAFRKGELGCPYSVKNHLALEPALHDQVLGSEPSSVEVEFGAFVEAAHAMGMRVMLDFAPRTTARDNTLILEHPEWFYWIDAERGRTFGAPRLEGVRFGIPKTSELGPILRRAEVRAHLSAFRHAPNETDPARWRRFVRRCGEGAVKDGMRRVVREFGVIPAPGFSDCINDPQPAWSDVTFLRMFLDHPAASVRHLEDPDRQPPYVFTDTIKSSKFPGRRPNRALWKYLSGILPFYQRFGVDGARVDMGHALPADLERQIVETSRRRDPDFCLLSEDLTHEGAAAARRAGYNALIGASWNMEPRHRQGGLHRLVGEILPRAALPALAAAELPDTPRAVTREGGRKFVRLVGVLNHFLPSAIPFVNSGLEVFERQPMNLGLDPQPRDRFVLPKSDPYYGKLAYFDRVALHWTHRGAGSLIELLGRASQVRRRFIAELRDTGNYFAPRVLKNARKVVAVGWRVEGGRSALIAVANIDFAMRRACVIGGLPGSARRRGECETLLEIRRTVKQPVWERGELQSVLGPGDVKIILVRSPESCG